MLNWSQQFNIFCFLDNCRYPAGTYECLLGVGAAAFAQSGQHGLQAIDELVAKKTWLFGHLSYELKDLLYGFSAGKPDPVGFPLFYFFVPQTVLYIRDSILYIESTDADAVYNSLQQATPAPSPAPAVPEIRQQLSRQQYIGLIQRLQQHILQGDCYEINFCQAFDAAGVSLNPVHTFQHLVQLSPNPFAALYRLNQQYLICASPERFLARRGTEVISQPIKGTAKRGQDPGSDEALKRGLLESDKEKAENVMVVDLVRNDLSRICREGSVQVRELYGIYTFPQVHQMISTVTGELRPDIRFSDIVRATFPMGSMTGAPKHRVLQLIDRYEPSARGIFSGSVGFITPGGDFDFNVVIRSIMYNAADRYLSYQVGSGITFYSEAGREWEECLLKGAAIKKVLTEGPAL